jgi:cytochrome c oxidase subunit 1
MTHSAAHVSYLEDGHTLRSWLLTTDHKRIAILYLIAITFFFFAAGSNLYSNSLPIPIFTVQLA